ncbi:MAG: hypothetical protein Q7T03_02805 [Deltaproteobacteria bacterium]|nr:hypothetical protein [Deltaproteobacteria bacterium]
MADLQLPSASRAPAKEAHPQNCPLCGFVFDSGAAACGGCAMFGGCNMIRCPNCRYEFVGDSKIVKWFQKLFKRKQS